MPVLAAAAVVADFFAPALDLPADLVALTLLSFFPPPLPADLVLLGETRLFANVSGCLGLAAVSCFLPLLDAFLVGLFADLGVCF